MAKFDIDSTWVRSIEKEIHDLWLIGGDITIDRFFDISIAMGPGPVRYGQVYETFTEDTLKEFREYVNGRLNSDEKLNAYPHRINPIVTAYQVGYGKDGVTIRIEVSFL